MRSGGGDVACTAILYGRQVLGASVGTFDVGCGLWAYTSYWLSKFVLKPKPKLLVEPG